MSDLSPIPGRSLFERCMNMHLGTMTAPMRQREEPESPVVLFASLALVWGVLLGLWIATP